jgi:hypothetical protein
VTFWAALVAYNPGLVEHHKQVQHTVLERNPEEAAAPTEVARKVAAEAVPVVHSTEEAVAPIVVVHKEVEVVHKVAAEADQAVQMAVAHKVIEAVAQDLAAGAGLDHKTWIIPPVRYVIISN